MTRVRVSTTVDSDRLATARGLRAWKNDASLAALLTANRAAGIDDAYRAYDKHPLDEADEWGDLASFRAAAGPSI
jgi:hypothetical protein